LPLATDQYSCSVYNFGKLKFRARGRGRFPITR
jgi:hypothetical protein